MSMRVAIIGNPDEQDLEAQVNERLAALEADGAVISDVAVTAAAGNDDNVTWKTATITYWPAEPESTS